MPFDLILQNNASKQIYLLSGLTDTSESSMAYLFEDFEMPESSQEGEYTCVLFRNGRKDVVYEFKNDILETIAHTGEGDVALRLLRPEIFLLKYGEINEVYGYRKSDKEYVYRKK